MTELEYLMAKDSILQIVTKLFNSADNKDWEKFKTCFDSEIIVNTGKEPKNLTPQQMADMWGKGMKNLPTVHQVSNFVVKINELKADVFCYAIALTYKEDPTGENTRTMVGSYDFQLIKDKIWKISQIQFNMKFMFGNQDL
jgi:hypothetical protein